MGSRNIRISDLDILILTVLYKLPWAQDYHVSLLIGEPIKYVRRRLQQLAEGGLVRRVNMLADATALNVITTKGISEAGFEPRSITRPTYFSVEHDRGVADAVVYFAILQKNGKYLTDLGSIITERDFDAVTDMEQVGTRSDGQPIYKSKSAEIHAPDAYIIKNGKYIAIEFERALKSKKSNSQMIDNAIDLRKRFYKQFWIYGNNAVRNKLMEIKEEIPEISMISIEEVRAYLKRRAELLPDTISAKTGLPAVNRVRYMKDPVPLNRLPLRGGIRLDTAGKSGKTSRHIENSGTVPQLVLE